MVLSASLFENRLLITSFSDWPLFDCKDASLIDCGRAAESEWVCAALVRFEREFENMGCG